MDFLTFYQEQVDQKFYWNYFFQEPLKPFKVKSKRTPIALLPELKLCNTQLLVDSHIEKLTCSKICFMFPIVIKAKMTNQLL